MEVTIDEMVMLVGVKEVEISKLRREVADLVQQLGKKEIELAKLRSEVVPPRIPPKP